MFIDAVQYAIQHSQELLDALYQHLMLVGVALGVAISISVPLGVWTSRSKSISGVLIPGFSALRVVPSLAILFLAIPYLGLSFASAALALTILAIPPVLVNTDAAFRSIDPAIIESATGMACPAGRFYGRSNSPWRRRSS